jgi:MFS family permease
MMNGLNILPQYTEYFHLNTVTVGLNNAATWMGAVLACLVLQPIPDRWGRKSGILIGSVVCIIGVIIQTAAQNIGTFVLGRIFIGIGSGISVGSVPTLIGEVLPPRVRGAVMGLYFSCYFVGSLISALVNYLVVDLSGTWAWRIPSVLQAFFSICAIATVRIGPSTC